MATATRRAPAALPALARQLARCFVEHDLLTHASAIAFRALVALVPLTLLGLAVLGAFGFTEVWTTSIAPPIQEHVSQPVFIAIDYTAERILIGPTAGLIAFAVALTLWDLGFGVLGIMAALNRIHEVKETRPFATRAALAVGLAAVTAACIVGAVLTVTAVPKLGGALDDVLQLPRWLFAAALLGLAVGLLVHYGPAERPEARWASAGSALVIGVWILASLGFRVWVSSVVDLETATGTLAAFLVLTAYVFVSSAILLVGVELDELLRQGRRNKRRLR